MFQIFVTLMIQLRRHATAVMVGSLITGIVWQAAAAKLQYILLPLTVACLTFSLLKVNPAEIIQALKRPLFAIAISAWTLVAIPGVLLLASQSGEQSGLRIGMIAILAAPPMMSVAAYGLFLGTNTSLLLGAVVPATMLSSLSLPLILAAIPGAPTAGNPGPLIERAAMIVGIGMIAALIIRRAAGLHRPERAAGPVGDICDGLTVICIGLIAVAVTAGLQPVLIAEPWPCITYFAIAVGLNLLVQVITAALFWPAGLQNALSAAMISGNRNLAIVIGVMAHYDDKNLQLFLAMSQLHVFFIPSIMRVAYRRLGLRPPADSGHS